MKYLPIFSILLVSASLASCSQDKDTIDENGLMPIRLATNVSNIDTRAQAQDVQLTSGQIVYVWAKHTGTNDDYLRAWSLTADGSGNLNPTTSTDWRYYPADGTNIDLYALHGNITDPATMTVSTTPNVTSSDDATDGTELPTIVTHTIKTSQESAANYSASDLFTVKVTDVGPYLNANQGNNYYATLPFQHQLARIEVRIVEFNDLLPNDVKSISLLGVKTMVPLTMPNLESENGAFGIVGTTIETTTSEIIMHPIDNPITKAECIIPQQQLTTPSLICISLKDNEARENVKLYYNPDYEICNFDIYNGVTYRFELTISKAELTGYAVGWALWDWKDRNSLEESDELPYYHKHEMNTSESSILPPTSANPDSNLLWEYGDGDNTNEINKGNGWK